MRELFDPEQAVAEARRDFGEHGAVSPSIERSSTFTVMEPGAMPEIFSGKRGPRCPLRRAGRAEDSAVGVQA